MAIPRAPRNTLNRPLIIEGARELLNQSGLAAFSMRALAQSLGVRPMALYHHISTKDELLALLVDDVLAEVALPRISASWRAELELRAVSLRKALNRHPWALPLLETQKHPGPNSLRHHETMLEVLRRAGFSVTAAAHAYAIFDAYIYGFVLQELMLTEVGLADDAPAVAAEIDFSSFPRLTELAQHYLTADTYPFDESFPVGLVVMLDGLAAIRERF